MASESFEVEEWDADFLDQLVQAEEQALSTQHPHHNYPPPPPPLPRGVSYSPPLELSQRTHETSSIPDSFANEQEIDRQQENESLVLGLERDRKEEPMEIIYSGIEANDAQFYLTKNKETDGLASSPSAPGTSTECQNANPSDKQLGCRTKSCNTGMQTDKTTEVTTSAFQNARWHSEKLFGLWNSSDQKQGRVLVANLYKTCERDFHVLSEYLSSPGNDSSMALSDQKCPGQVEETAKIVHLYSVFTKISNNTLRLEDLLEALVDLCYLKNDFIVHWSLRVLHKILSNSFGMEKEFAKRENVEVEEPLSGNTKSDTNESGNLANESLCFANVAEKLKQGQIPSPLKLSNSKTPVFSGFFSQSVAASVSRAYEVSAFEHMCLIAAKNNEEQIRCEALSIMNLILMRHNAYSERYKFAGELAFRSLSQLLSKEAGFRVQDAAVRALFLLFNCPKVIAIISSRPKDAGELESPKDISDSSILTSQVLDDILTGLADCIVCYGSATAEEMKLRRNAIVFLAFLGSSGKSGIDILLNHRLPKGGTNFLAIILQSLMSDLDLKASKSARRRSDIAQEQSLLIREALILLNTLVSHPQHSVPVLQALTATRDMASTTVDVANRLTRKRNLLLQKDKESEIVDLALVFKKRVFSFLGDNIA